MLEILYDVATKEVRAWNADDNVQGNLRPREGQEVVTWDIEPPAFKSDIYYVDLAYQAIVGNPDYVEPPPPRDLAAEIDDLKAKIEKQKKVKDGT